MSEIIQTYSEHEEKPSDLTLPELAFAVRALAESIPEKSDLVMEAAAKLEQLQNLNKLLGLLAPGGTAPRAAMEQLWSHSESGADEFPVLLELRAMLTQHWGEWTPAIRAAAGLPPKE